MIGASRLRNRESRLLATGKMHLKMGLEIARAKWEIYMGPTRWSQACGACMQPLAPAQSFRHESVAVFDRKRMPRCLA